MTKISNKLAIAGIFLINLFGRRERKGFEIFSNVLYGPTHQKTMCKNLKSDALKLCFIARLPFVLMSVGDALANVISVGSTEECIFRCWFVPEIYTSDCVEGLTTIYLLARKETLFLLLYVSKTLLNLFTRPTSSFVIQIISDNPRLAFMDKKRSFQKTNTHAALIDS
ncbi:hypothetical protein BD560DRAFT_424543 [Blakeslea trispora]|nr:hypothetical protein BD560DRAFT_424543 [Blakeslea trispora]